MLFSVLNYRIVQGKEKKKKKFSKLHPLSFLQCNKHLPGFACYSY